MMSVKCCMVFVFEGLSDNMHMLLGSNHGV